MNGVLNLFGGALVAVGTFICERTAGFSERRAAEFLNSFAAAEEAAADAEGTRDPGALRLTNNFTSHLITAAANQLQCWMDGQSMHKMRRDYLDELLDELRDRAAQFQAIRD